MQTSSLARSLKKLQSVIYRTKFWYFYWIFEERIPMKNFLQFDDQRFEFRSHFRWYIYFKISLKKYIAKFLDESIKRKNAFRSFNKNFHQNVWKTFARFRLKKTGMPPRTSYYNFTEFHLYVILNSETIQKKATRKILKKLF